MIMPANYYKLLNKMIYKFIRALNWEKIILIKLYNAYADGGGGQMIDMQSYVLALQIKWNYYFLTTILNTYGKLLKHAP